jgi:hypothetical protein
MVLLDRGLDGWGVCVCEGGMGVSSESYGGVRVSDHL